MYAYCFACRRFGDSSVCPECSGVAFRVGSTARGRQLAATALRILVRGRAFEDQDRGAWDRAPDVGGVLLTELQLVLPDGRSGRVDVAVHLSGADGVVLVELKSTDWDRQAERRVRPNLRRHVRQVMRYVAGVHQALHLPVHPALTYPSAPEQWRREKIEALLADEMIECVWRDDEQYALAEL